MFQCVCFIIVLLILFILLFFMLGKDIFAPPVIFCACFIVAMICLAFNVEYWDVELHWNTLGVLLCGIMSFSIPSWLIYIKNMQKSKNLIGNRQTNRVLKNIYIDPVVSICFLFFEIGSVLLAVMHVMQFSGTSNLTEAIAAFRQATLFGTSAESEAASFPTLISICFFTTRRIGFVWIYIIINNFLVTKRFKVVPFINYLISLASPLVTGQRGSIIEMLIGSLIIFVVLYGYSQHQRKKIKFKYKVAIALLLIVALLSFTWLGTIIGRTDSDMSETIAKYLGAPILNLDSWLQENYSASAFLDNLTIQSLLEDLGEIVGFSVNEVSNVGFGFRSANGHSVGNVYTTFGTFFYDAGWFGVICYSFIMGTIVQSIYCRCKTAKDNKPLKFVLLAYFYPLVALSFFGNRFYAVFDMEFIKSLIVWYVMFFIIFKIRVIETKKVKRYVKQN